MKRLIVNADDVGADEARNAGIFEAIDAGIVTSISILPNGPATADAVRQIRSRNCQNISLGMHFNLSEGMPLSPGLRLLAASDGHFLGKKSAQRLLVQHGDSELEREIRSELGAQIAVFQNAGIPIDHLDGHQHVHVFPAAARLCAETAREHGIRWIRVPEEPENEPESVPLSPAIIEEARFFSGHAKSARLLFRASEILSADHFRGLYLKGRLPDSLWLEFLKSIPEGITELMVHPGHAARDNTLSPFSGFSTSDREKELAALTDGRFRQALLKTGVELMPFPKTPSPDTEIRINGNLLGAPSSRRQTR
jgi:chitin disaccharide deacetylase